MKFSLKSTMFAATLLAIFNASHASDDSQHFNNCVTKIKALYGESTQVKLRKTSTFKGIKTFSLKVLPKGESRTTLKCSETLDDIQTVSLTDKKGNALQS